MIASRRLRAALTALILAGGPGDTPRAQAPDPLDAIKTLVVDGRYAEAEAAARDELARVEAAGATDSVLVAAALDVLVDALSYTGKSALPETQELAVRAVGIKERLLGPEHPDLAASLYNLAWIRMEAGDNAGARPLYERALGIRESAVGPDHPEVAEILNGLGVVLKRAGDYARARSILERALGIRERAFGPDDRRVAVILNNLAAVDVDTGDYARARSAFARVLAILEKVLGPDHPNVGLALNNLGAVAWRMADLSQADAYLQRALAITEHALGPEHPMVASRLHSLANVLVDLGDHDRARRLYSRAVELRERNSPTEPGLAATLMQLASLLTATGDLAEAGPLFERAVALSERTIGTEHPHTAEALFGLAGWLRASADDVTARRYYERAIAIWEKQFGSDYPLAAAARVDLAGILATTGELDSALTTALGAESTRSTHLRRTLQTLPERQALAYAGAWRSGIDTAVFLLTRQPREASRYAAAVLDAVIRSRALVLDEMASRHRAMGADGGEAIAPLVRDYGQERERLANLLVRAASDPSPELMDRIQRATDAGERSERLLAEASAAFRVEQARRHAGLSDVAARLAPDSALVAFVGFRAGAGSEPGVNVLARSLRRDEYAAFVLRSGASDPIVVPLGESASIEAAITAWRQGILQEATAPPGSSRRTLATYARVGAALRRKVWDPLESHLQGIGRVYIVPDGEIHLVDFAALPTGSGRYLVESGPELHYLSAERDLIVDAKTPPGEGLLAVGAPAYDDRSQFHALNPRSQGGGAATDVVRPGQRLFRGARPGCGALADLRFGPLPASAGEAAGVISVWKRSAAVPMDAERAALESGIGLDRVVDLQGAKATETAFKRAAPGRRVLHLATHGFVLGDDCRPLSAPSENSLLLAGLAFAGANHRTAASADEDDGILTAEEIGAMDLSGVEWAVLSACDTALGERRMGEGLLGLRRAFQVAGATTVIMSLWPVEDQATARWMSSLYTHRFVGGSSTVQAVRAAHLDRLRQRRQAGLSTHPFYWAGFIAAGHAR